MAKQIGKLDAKTTAFFCCDIQEKFRPMIKYFEEIVNMAGRLCRASKILNVPLVVTQQYPKGLGNTVAEIDVSHGTTFDKTRFSMSLPEVHKHLKEACPNLKSVVLFGVEAHVCVQQTALDLLEMNVEVHVAVDASSSRSNADRKFAFDRIRQAGGYITTCESVLFMLVQDSTHPHFKDVQKCILEQGPLQGLVFNDMEPRAEEKS